MCGRYAYDVSKLGRWKAVFALLMEGIENKYNIAPSASVPVFTRDGWCTMRWGLVPSWSKEAKTKYATFNARVESFTEKPAFRSAWKQERRCLIPLSGYYEWKVTGGEKRAYYVTTTLDEPLVIAGLWEKWEKDSHSMLSCTILTTAAEGILADLHHRMPVMLEPAQASTWLRGEKQQALEVLQNPSLEHIHFYQVNPAVGNPRNQGRGLIDPYDSE